MYAVQKVHPKYVGERIIGERPTHCDRDLLSVLSACDTDASAASFTAKVDRSMRVNILLRFAVLCLLLLAFVERGISEPDAETSAERIVPPDEEADHGVQIKLRDCEDSRQRESQTWSEREASMSQEIAELREETIKLRQLYEESARGMDGVQGSLAVCTASLHDKEALVAESQKDMIASTQQLSDLKESGEECTRRLDDLRVELSSCEEDVICEPVHVELEMANKEIERLQDEKERLESVNQETTSMVASLKSEQSNCLIEAGRLSSLKEDSLKQTELAHRSLESCFSNLREKDSLLNEANENSTIAAQEISDLRGSNERCMNQLGHLMEQLSGCKEDIICQPLQLKLDDANGEILRLKDESSRVSSKIASIEHEKGKLDESLYSCESRFQTMHRSLEEQRNTTMKEVDNLESQTASLKSENLKLLDLVEQTGLRAVKAEDLAKSTKITMDEASSVAELTVMKYKAEASELSLSLQERDQELVALKEQLQIASSNVLAQKALLDKANAEKDDIAMLLRHAKAELHEMKNEFDKAVQKELADTRSRTIQISKKNRFEKQALIEKASVTNSQLLSSKADAFELRRELLTLRESSCSVGRVWNPITLWMNTQFSGLSGKVWPKIGVPLQAYIEHHLSRLSYVSTQCTSKLALLAPFFMLLGRALQVEAQIFVLGLRTVIAAGSKWLEEESQPYVDDLKLKSKLYFNDLKAKNEPLLNELKLKSKPYIDNVETKIAPYIGELKEQSKPVVSWVESTGMENWQQFAKGFKEHVLDFDYSTVQPACVWGLQIVFDFLQAVFKLENGPRLLVLAFEEAGRNAGTLLIILEILFLLWVATRLWVSLFVPKRSVSFKNQEKY